MMAAQMELRFTPAARRKMAGPDLAAEMIDILTIEHDLGKAWVKRADLEQYGFTDRMCRLARQCAGGLVLFGQRGYRLTSAATLDEIRRAASTLESQARVMMTEAQELWRVMHGRGVKAI